MDFKTLQIGDIIRVKNGYGKLLKINVYGRKKPNSIVNIEYEDNEGFIHKYTKTLDYTFDPPRKNNSVDVI